MNSIKKARYSIWSYFQIKDEIAEIIEDGVDPETGEILNGQMDNQLRKLEMDKEVVFAEVGKVIKAIKIHNKNLKERKKEIQDDINASEKQMQSLKDFIRFELEEGKTIKFDEVHIYWGGESEAVEIDMEEVDLTQMDKIKALTYEPKISKTVVKKYLEENPGFTLRGVTIRKNNKSITIK